MNSILQRLIEMDEKNRLHHGFLMVGSEATNLKETMDSFVLHLLSKDQQDDQKEILQKKIANQNHPDFFKLEPDDGEIKIETIREMQRWLSIPPLESSKKIILIHGAHHLNASCSNALLKTLEEPPFYAILFLVTHTISHILPTIRSRLFCIQFPEIEKTSTDEEKEWVGELETLLAKKTYTDKEIFTFTEKLSDQRQDLVFFFNLVHKTIRNKMLEAHSVEFNRLEKMFDLTLNLEHELYQNYGNISLGLDRFFIEWRNT